MRPLHPGFFAHLELNLEDLKAYLGQDFDPIAEEEVSDLIGLDLLGAARGLSSSDLTRLPPLGSA